MIGNLPIFSKWVRFFIGSKILNIPIVTDFYTFEITNITNSNGIRSSSIINSKFIESAFLPDLGLVLPHISVQFVLTCTLWTKYS